MGEQEEDMDNIRVVLASASPRREELLRQIGIIPEVIPSEIEEKVTEKEPDRVVTELSRQKAEEVAARLGETDAQTTVVVGSDTVVYANGEILGKPADEADAARMLRMLQGDSHNVYTGVTLIAGNKKRSFAVETRVDVYPMSEKEIESYIACKESDDKAGAYGIQGRFAAYIRGIDGSYTNVMGLPAGRVYQEMKQLLEDRND